MKNSLRILSALLGAMALLSSCSRHEDNSADINTLVSVGKARLTKQDLQAAMPGGLTQEDSIRLAHAFIYTWIDTQLAAQVAADEIDMKQIDKIVQDYRNELIMREYVRQMYDSHVDSYIPEDTLKAYYEIHKEEFILSRPMVKGVYLKVADDAKSLHALRKLYSSTKHEDIDNIDKSELAGAVHFDYFHDRWIDWEQIESRIPYDFGPSPESYLRSHKNLDFSSGGFTYLLSISDVLHSGEPMPFEAAKNLIIDRLNFENRKAYEKQLKKDLYDNALKKGKIKISCDL